jgi:NAD(P)H-dependent FMN reductase
LESQGVSTAYNDDVMAKGDPKPVAAFKTAIGEADAMLIATPEYNYGVQECLKTRLTGLRDQATTPC